MPALATCIPLSPHDLVHSVKLLFCVFQNILLPPKAAVTSSSGKPSLSKSCNDNNNSLLGFHLWNYKNVYWAFQFGPFCTCATIRPRQEDRFSDPKRLSSSGLLEQRPNWADVLVYQARNKTPGSCLTYSGVYSLCRAADWTRCSKYFLKTWKIKCSLTYLIHSTQEWKKKTWRNKLLIKNIYIDK